MRECDAVSRIFTVKAPFPIDHLHCDFVRGSGKTIWLWIDCADEVGKKQHKKIAMAESRSGFVRTHTPTNENVCQTKLGAGV